jgi:integrase
MKGCRPFSDAEVVLVLQHLSGPFALRDRALFLLGVRSGFRISELLSLRRCDLVTRGGIAERVSVARKNMKKKVEGRTVLIHPEAREALAMWMVQLYELGYMTPECFVFQSRTGPNAAISRVQAYRLLSRACDNAGLSGKLGTHSMRKTFADKIYDRLGHDLIKTQRALGHKNINSTVSYLSFREEEIDEAILGL